MNRHKPQPGFTLAEVTVTIVVLAVVSLGAVSYQYHAVHQAKIGKAKMAAARLGTLILESWKSQGGNGNYDPADLNLGIERLDDSNQYELLVDRVPFYLTLTTEDIETNETTGTTLRQLTVSVHWRPDFARRLPRESHPGTTFYTYVRRDQSGG